MATLAGPEPGQPVGGPAGELAGFEVHAHLDSRFAEFSLAVLEANIEIRCPIGEWSSIDPVTLVERLERRIQHLDSTLAEVRDDHSGATREAEKVRTRIGCPSSLRATSTVSNADNKGSTRHSSRS